MPNRPQLSDSEAMALLSELRERVDVELLTAWDADLPELTSGPVRDLESAGLLFTYRAGKPRRPYAYFTGLYRPGDAVGPGSAIPPPSIQSQATWVMYGRRDGHACHLCGLPVVNDWRRPNEFHSLDHFIPRSKGGTNCPSNIRLAHASCNKGRRDRDVAEFRSWLAGRSLAVKAV